MKCFILEAKSRGFDLWYDRGLGLWTLTSEDAQPAEYFTKARLNNMGMEKFIQVFLTVPE